MQTYLFFVINSKYSINYKHSKLKSKLRIYKLELRFFTHESSSVARFLFAAGTLNLCISQMGVSHRAPYQFHYNYSYLHLKVYYFIDILLANWKLFLYLGEIIRLVEE